MTDTTIQGTEAFEALAKGKFPLNLLRHAAAYADNKTHSAWWAWQAAKEQALLQLFLDPENQPTQFGTVTLAHMDKEIAELKGQVVNLLAQRDELLEDALRYRHLRNQRFDGTNARHGDAWVVVYAHEQGAVPAVHVSSFGFSLDRAIDQARGKQ